MQTISTNLLQAVRFFCSLLVCLFLFGCGADQQQEIAVQDLDLNLPDANGQETIDPVFDSEIRELIAGYLQQIEVDYLQLESAIDILLADVTIFLEQPDSNTLEQLRESWLFAHSAYELTALHRYFANHILAEQDALELSQLLYQINHWPILAGYIDYVDAYPESGIVQDVNVLLTEDSLRSQHGSFDLSEATLGFHVLEFLIWGSNSDQGSARLASDYLESTELSSIQISNGFELDQLTDNRRRQLLLLVTQTLRKDFQQVRTLWIDRTSSLQQRVERSQNVSSQQLLILTIDAMTSMLTEELLVRSLYPMLNGEFNESIQSPFSHSTQNAVSSQLIGFERLLLESQSESGMTFDILLSSASEDFSEFFYQNFDASKECLVRLYSTMDSDSGAVEVSEFEIVECINLVTNMIDNLEQIRRGFSN